jgi:CheY-like chemotaxis protein
LESLAAIGETVLSAGELTKHLLTFSRRGQATVRATDLNQLIASSHRLLQRIAGDRSSLRLNLTKAPWTVRLDPPQLEQVLVNLVINAVQASPEGTTITITTERSSLGTGAAAELPAMLVRVQDEGPGMPAKLLARIFEPFFSTKPSGTGLGLATCKDIVESFGGRLSVSSELAVGTEFSIRLPAEPGVRPEKAALLDTPARNVGAGFHVLVIEDQPHVRQAISSSLELFGYEVKSAGSRDEALDALAAGAPVELIVSDADMPGLSLPGFVRALPEQVSRAALVIISGDPSAEERARELRLIHRGPVEFLAKPFNPAYLASKLWSLTRSMGS